MFKTNRTILLVKVRESIASVLPITSIVFLLCFTVIPIPTGLQVLAELDAAREAR